MIILFGKCPAVTTVEYSSYEYCKAVMESIQAGWDKDHVDGSVSCFLKD